LKITVDDRTALVRFLDGQTASYPAQFLSRVTVQLKSGQSLMSDYPGFPTRPFTWEEISAKFDKLPVLSTVNLAIQRIRRHTLMVRCIKLFVSCLVLGGLLMAAAHKG
jgi:hypothetical protein